MKSIILNYITILLPFLQQDEMQ